MRAVRQGGYGDCESVLSMDDIAKPVPTPTQVLVRVHSAAINRIDYRLLTGELKLVTPITFPRTPGSDVAGVVVAVGDECERIRVDDYVYATTMNNEGAFAEYVVVDETLVGLMPRAVTFAQAATAPICAQTALTALQTVALEPLQKILIIGASGGVGSFAIQMAKAMGASFVTAVCGPKNADYCRALGADKVIDYFNVKWYEVSAGENYDVILDAVGGASQWNGAHNTAGVLINGGSFITLIGDHNWGTATMTTVAEDTINVVSRQFLSNFGVHHNYILHRPTTNYKTLKQVTRLIDDNKVRLDSVIEKSYDLTIQNVCAMYGHTASRRIRGKEILRLIPD